MAISTLLKGLMAALLIVIMDSADLIIITYALIGLHVLSGWAIMLRNKHTWDKQKWFQTSMKLLWFPLVIMATKWIKHTYEIEIPIGAIVSGFLSVNELKGFIDNVGKLTGIDIWNAIADQIDWKKFRMKK